MDRKQALMLIARTVLIACMVARQGIATVTGFDAGLQRDHAPIFSMAME